MRVCVCVPDAGLVGHAEAIQLRDGHLPRHRHPPDRRHRSRSAPGSRSGRCASRPLRAAHPGSHGARAAAGPACSRGLRRCCRSGWRSVADAPDAAAAARGRGFSGFSSTARDPRAHRPPWPRGSRPAAAAGAVQLAAASVPAIAHSLAHSARFLMSCGIDPLAERLDADAPHGLEELLAILALGHIHIEDAARWFRPLHPWPPTDR